MPTFAIVKKYEISTCTLSSAEEKKASICRNTYIYVELSDTFYSISEKFRTKHFGHFAETGFK